MFWDKLLMGNSITFNVFFIKTFPKTKSLQNKQNKVIIVDSTYLQLSKALTLYCTKANLLLITKDTITTDASMVAIITTITRVAQGTCSSRHFTR